MSSHNSLSPSKAGDVLEHVIDDGVRLEDLKLHVVSNELDQVKIFDMIEQSLQNEGMLEFASAAGGKVDDHDQSTSSGEMVDLTRTEEQKIVEELGVARAIELGFPPDAARRVVGSIIDAYIKVTAELLAIEAEEQAAMRRQIAELKEKIAQLRQELASEPSSNIFNDDS